MGVQISRDGDGAMTSALAREASSPKSSATMASRGLVRNYFPRAASGIGNMRGALAVSAIILEATGGVSIDTLLRIWSQPRVR